LVLGQCLCLLVELVGHLCLRGDHDLLVLEEYLCLQVGQGDHGLLALEEYLYLQVGQGDHAHQVELERLFLYQLGAQEALSQRVAKAQQERFSQ